MPISLIPTTISGAYKYSEMSQDALISLNFDDGYLSVFNRAFPILERHDLLATIFVITDNIGKDNYLDLRHLEILAGADWEIGSHTVSHAQLTELSEAGAYGELSLSKKLLEDAGFCINTFAVPFGDANQKVWQYVKEHYQFSRDVSDALNPRPFDHHELKCFGLLATTEIKEVRDRIDKCIKEGTWLILGFHQIGETGTYNNSVKFLEEVCEYIKSKER